MISIQGKRSNERMSCDLVGVKGYLNENIKLVIKLTLQTSHSNSFRGVLLAPSPLFVLLLLLSLLLVVALL